MHTSTLRAAGGSIAVTIPQSLVKPTGLHAGDKNRLGMIGVCPITQGGMGARNAGMSVSLMGTGTQTQGVVVVHQFRMIDPTQRDLILIEQAPDDLAEEVRARVAALMD